MTAIIRLAESKDLPSVANIFVDAFADSIYHYFGPQGPRRQIVEDLFAFVLAVEPNCFRVAQLSNGPIVGYVLSPSSMPRLWWSALCKGYLCRWIARFLMGRYPISLSTLGKLSLNKFGLITSQQHYRGSAPSQILSVAVSPVYASRGFGKQLLQAALTHLQQKGLSQVKLEVRPWNQPALHLYKKLGFEQRTTTKDSQGEWLVMVKQFVPNKLPGRPR